jgi:hypothetical protein
MVERGKTACCTLAWWRYHLAEWRCGGEGGAVESAVAEAARRSAVTVSRRPVATLR